MYANIERETPRSEASLGGWSRSLWLICKEGYKHLTWKVGNEEWINTDVVGMYEVWVYTV